MIKNNDAKLAFIRQGSALDHYRVRFETLFAYPLGSRRNLSSTSWKLNSDDEPQKLEDWRSTYLT